MKNNQYFGLLDSDDNLITGKAVVEKERILLYSNDAKKWMTTIGGTDIDTTFTYFTEIEGDLKDPVDIWETDSIYGYTPISKERYLSLQKSKRERESFEKELLNKYLLGEIVSQPVRKMGDKYVFGCGAVSITKAEMKSLTAKIESIKKTQVRFEEIEQEISELDGEKAKIEDKLETEWEKLNSALDFNLTHESIELDEFDDIEMKNIYKILSK